MQNTLLFGNGFNRMRNEGISWEDILNDLKEENFNNADLPYTLVYEKALLDSAIKNKKIRGYEFTVKKRLAELMNKMIPANIYHDLHKLNIKNYLTTNYDYSLNKVLNSYNIFEENNSTEDIYSIRRKSTFYDSKNKEVCNIWNIHGEINKPISMMLGFDHYTGSLGKLESYVKGNYEFISDKQPIKPKSIRSKITGENLFDKYSWIESFFCENIHIIGLKLDYTETDIYWILNKRRRLYIELGAKLKIKNNITFYTRDSDESKHSLLKSFGVNVVYKNWSHDEIYNHALSKIK